MNEVHRLSAAASEGVSPEAPRSAAARLMSRLRSATLARLRHSGTSSSPQLRRRKKPEASRWNAILMGVPDRSFRALVMKPQGKSEAVVTERPTKEN